VRKIRLLRILLILFLLLLKNITIVAIILSSPVFQSFITKKTMEFFAKRYDITMSIEKVYVRFPDKFVMTDIYIEDQAGDTLIYSHEIYTEISKFKYFDKQLHIEKLNIINPFLNICIDSTRKSNYGYLLEKFSSPPDTTNDSSSSFDIYCDKFNFINARLNYKNEGFVPIDSIFDASAIELRKFDVLVHNFSYDADTVGFSLKNLQFIERSGFKFNNISACVQIFDLGININNFALNSNNSQIICPVINLSGKETDYLSDPVNKLSLELEIDSSYFNIADLGYIFPKYKNINDIVSFSGKFSGNLSRIKVNDFNLDYGSDTKLNANLSLDGLPDLNFTFIFGTINEFSTSSRDIYRLTESLSPEKPVKLPDFINELGNIGFTGNITGLINDAVAYGNFTTNIGNIDTDLGLTVDFEKGIYGYSGKLSANNLHLGRIIDDEENFGRLSLTADLDGTIDTVGNFSTVVNCRISTMDLMGYNYKNIRIDGNASNNYYRGKLNISDPNLKINLSGLYDHRNEFPRIEYEGDFYANLMELNLIDDTIPSSIKTKSSAKMSGDLLNMPEGYLKITDFVYRKDNDSIFLNRLNLDSYYDESKRQHFIVKSDFTDIDFNGKYQFAEMLKKTSQLVYNYFPSIADEDYTDELITDNRANFNIRIKNVNRITAMLAPQLIIDDEISIIGKINTNSNAIEAEMQASSIIYDSIYFDENHIKLRTFPDSIRLNMTVKEFSTPAMRLVENLDFGLNVLRDSITIAMLWDNYDSLNNSGNIFIASSFTKRSESKIPLIKTEIYDSYIKVQNREWLISKTPIIIDTTNITINRFQLTYDNQNLLIDGEISEDPSKRLRFTISDVDVYNFNNYIGGAGYSFSGFLTGNGRVANLYKTPSMRTSLSIRDFYINDEDFGRFDISGSYDAGTGAFVVDGTNKYMRLRGNYVPETDTILLTLNLENFNLEILQEYMYEYELSELEGSINLFLNISGELSNPDVSGFLNFNQANLTYDFLKLRVSTNDRVKITNNAILFENFRVYDDFNNAGFINGGVYHDKFSDINFDFQMNVRRMRVLNTTERDNSLYFGTVFATGNARIKGTIDKFGIDVEGTTDPGTVFVLPMTESYDQKDVGFVTFVQPTTIEDTITELIALKNQMEYYFRMDVEVTPVAETQIVFDPKVGDLIRGFCRGNIKMEYTSDEEFYMYGELEVVEGDYLFTLQNVINKRFHIKPGGTIIWDGDPYEANVDLDAVYYLRAPLIDLMRAYNDTSDVYRRPTQVECHMHMAGNLMAPDITFSIKVPNADEKARAQLANMTQDDINKQMLYLLILNRFNSPADMRADNTSTTNAFGVTSSELLSNQLSNWLSQISKDFDIGFKYRPGTEVSGQELELALSTQLLNDRVLINGNVGYGENMTSATSNIVGDVEVQFKVNPKGSFRIKGFTRANDELNQELGQYTSGMGIFYTEDFNTLGELFGKLYRSVTFKNYRESRKEEKQETE
jgi:hypothetical protein